MTIVSTPNFGSELNHLHRSNEDTPLATPAASDNNNTSAEHTFGLEDTEATSALHSGLVGPLLLRKKRDFFNAASIMTEVEVDPKMEETTTTEPQSPNSERSTASSRPSGFMITDILSNANRGQAAVTAAAAAAAAAAALQNRLQGSAGVLGLHPGLTEFHLQQQIQQFHAHQQQQAAQGLHGQVPHHEASSDDGEAMSDDETTSSKDFDQGKKKNS